MNNYFNERADGSKTHVWKHLWKSTFPGDKTQPNIQNNPLQVLVNFWGIPQDSRASCQWAFSHFPAASWLPVELIQRSAGWCRHRLDLLLLLHQAVPAPKGSSRGSCSKQSLSPLSSGSCHYLSSSSPTATAKTAWEQGAKNLSPAEIEEAAWLGTKV